MKPYLYLGAVLAAAMVVRAQTSAPVGAARPPAQIYAETVRFDTKTRVAVYQGEVRVDDTEMKLSCDTLTVHAPEQSGRIERLVAEGNVVVDWLDDSKQVNHATGKRLVYTFKVENNVTNDLAVLTGEPRVERPQFWLEGQVITWDRVTGMIDATKQHMVFKTDIMGGGTNQPAAVEKTPATTP